MSACGMGFNLFKKHGRQNFILTFKYGYKRDWRLIAKDTLGPLACKVIGHRPFDAAFGSTGCNRCGQFIKEQNGISVNQ